MQNGRDCLLRGQGQLHNSADMQASARDPGSTEHVAGAGTNGSASDCSRCLSPRPDGCRGDACRAAIYAEHGRLEWSPSLGRAGHVPFRRSFSCDLFISARRAQS